LGGNYKILVDDKATNDYDMTETGPSKTTISVKYSQSAKSIDVIGTTVIPEFGSAITLIAVTVGIITTIILGTIFPSSRWPRR